MGMKMYYIRHKTEGWGMDKHGRWTDNIRQWEIYTRRDSCMNAMLNYPESTLGIL